MCFHNYYKCETKLSKRVKEIVLNSFCEPEFNIELLADKLGMSKSALSRNVRKSTGLTPIKYVNTIKICYSVELLSDKELSIKEIAYTVGFSDPKYFTRCFKKIIGLTPKEYRDISGDLIELKWNGLVMN